MSFNFDTTAQEQQLVDLARELAKDPKPWMPAVDGRYGRLLRIQANAAQAALDKFKTRSADVPPQNRGKADDHLNAEANRIAQLRGLAQDLISGVTTARAPARCEALCRLYEKNTGVTL